MGAPLHDDTAVAMYHKLSGIPIYVHNIAAREMNTLPIIHVEYTLSFNLT